jgi:diphosphomevalonate decarboxylase
MATILATHTAPTNIATIKYWGKRDAGSLNLPINSRFAALHLIQTTFIIAYSCTSPMFKCSVSVTMNQDDLKAITTIVASPAFDKDRLWLNGV